LKPENILVELSEGESGLDFVRAVIIDLGISKKFQKVVPGRRTPKWADMWTSTGTQAYCAPEMFLGGGYTKNIDTWALGVIMYQCLTGSLPFLHETVLGTIECIMEGALDLDNPHLARLDPTAKLFL
jgi:calcium-dependent protein kinase